jgi:hypothetical protein
VVVLDLLGLLVMLLLDGWLLRLRIVRRCLRNWWRERLDRRYVIKRGTRLERYRRVK